MPFRPNKSCSEPNCQELVRPQHRYCPRHRSAYTRARDKRRRDTGPYREYASPKYRALRKIVLEEEPICHWCRLEGVANPKPSTDADHVVPLARGGPTSRENLVGSCQRCNRGRSNTRRGHEVYCPLGHVFVYGETIEKENRELRERLELERNNTEFWREQEQKAQRRVAAEKGAKTKLRKRIEHGVCPHCKRHFENIERHVKSKHPEKLSDEGEK